MADPVGGYFRNIFGNPFEEQDVSTPAFDTRREMIPSSRMPARETPQRRPDVTTQLGPRPSYRTSTPGPQEGQYLTQPWDPSRERLSSTPPAQNPDQRKMADAQAYLQKTLQTLPANDPRRSIYEFLLASQKYEGAFTEGVKNLRMQPEQMPLHPSVAGKIEVRPDVPTVTPNTIKPGYTIGGYQFQGGNPRDQRSWKKIG